MKLSFQHLSFVLLPVVALGCVEMDDESIGDTSQVEEAVSNGAIENAVYPWVVHLSSGCGGTLIAPQWVLSAAHCWYPGSPFPSVSYERKNPSTGAITSGTRTVAAAYQHPSYGGADTPHDDLLLLRLTSTFQYPNPDPLVEPVELGLGAPFGGQTGVLVNHGHGGGPMPEGTVSVFRGTVDARTADATTFKARSSTAALCQGDSGSGFAMYGGGKWFVTGVVSSAPLAPDASCTNPGDYATFMDVHAYAPWIRSIVPGLPAPAHLGTADLLTRDSSGLLRVRFMDSGTTTSQSTVSYFQSGQPVTTDWKVIATADFNGDGHKDILWRHTGGKLAIWTMLGSTMTSDHSPSYQSQGGIVGNEWQIIGVGDFDRDGTTDLVWRHTNGSVAIWLIRGAEFYSDRVPGSMPSSWTLLGRPATTTQGPAAEVSDFDRDGVPDLLWRNTSTGEMQIWFMSLGGGFYPRTFSPNAPALSWKIEATGDFTSDGHADILWRDTSGNLALWLISGRGTAIAYENPPPVSTLWTIVGTGDFDGDGDRDILWRHAGGSLAIWFMYGGLNFAQAYPAPLGTGQSIVGITDLD